jgi:lauroyl/myristoyl acyltransferase
MPGAQTLYPIMKHKPAHIFEYVLVVSLGGAVRLLPLRIALALGWLAAAASHFIGRVKVQRTCERIRQVLGPEASESTIRRIAWLSWRNLFFNAVEGFRFTRLSAKKIRRMPIALIEKDLKRIQQDCANGFILATPHMGNWEIAGVAGDLLGFPLFVIVREQKNPLINDYINRMRRSFSLEVLHRESRAWKGVADRIRQGKILAILPDIGVRRNGMEIDFLNNKATIASGAAHFAQVGDCPIYPVFVRRIGWTKHDALLLDPILPDPAADPAEDRRRIMQEIMSVFTAEILKTPEQYFWHNKRWVLNKD